MTRLPSSRRGGHAAARPQGFTLIELLVAVTIAAILAAVGVPMYADYVVRSRVPEATNELSARLVRMEQFFQDNRTYVNAPDCPASGSPHTTVSTYFNFSCAASQPTATTFTLQAVGKGAMAGFTYTVNQANVRTTTTTSAVPPGWYVGSTVNCWITKGGGQC